MTALLEKDYTIYLDHLDEFLQDHRGDFVLIKNQKVVDFFPTYEKALKSGLKRFGNVPFFIKVVQQEEEVHFFHQGILSWRMGSSFHLKLPHLREIGPICEIILKPSDLTIKKLKLEKKDIPYIKVRALIDTGASSTAISKKVVDRLKLVPRGTAKVYTSNKNAEIRNEYDVSLEFDTEAYLEVLRALEANLQDHSIDCLIGRDVLHLGVFTYDGPKKEIKLNF